MFRYIASLSLIILLVGCSIHSTPQMARVYSQESDHHGGPAVPVKDGQLSPPAQHDLSKMDVSKQTTPVSTNKIELMKTQQPFSDVKDASSATINVSPLKSETINIAKAQALNENSGIKTPAQIEKNQPSKNHSAKDRSQASVKVSSNADKDEVERDIMEEALFLLNESHRYWVNGDLEDAFETLDQAYALILDTNGNPDIARQKDDLRLMISKQILTIYNSVQTNAKGVRSEIPLIINADVEKEIRQFQTVERDFFIMAYQRSVIYRPMILNELKQAGLPEELSWLPLVESGFKINALSSARALGLWQFIPSTGYKYGLNRDEWVDERMDMEKSTRAAIDYLKELHKMFGDWLTVLAAYNCGEGRVMRTISRQHINYLDRFWDLYHQLPYETARYVPRFLATVAVIKDPKKYGIDLGNIQQSTLSFETVEIQKSVRLQDIAKRLDLPEETLNILNAELRYKITPNAPYKLRVPIDMARNVLQVMDDISPAENHRDSVATKRGLIIKHKVRRGENLNFLALKYNTSSSAIRAANHLSRNEHLAVGRRLNIPVQRNIASNKTEKLESYSIYKVQKGDTLSAIARKHDTSVSEVKKANELKSDQLIIGQKLRIK